MKKLLDSLAAVFLVSALAEADCPTEKVSPS